MPTISGAQIGSHVGNIIAQAAGSGPVGSFVGGVVGEAIGFSMASNLGSSQGNASAARFIQDKALALAAIEMEEILEDIFDEILDQAEAQRFEETTEDYGSSLPERPGNNTKSDYRGACCVDNCPMNSRMNAQPFCMCGKCGHPVCVMHVQKIKGTPLCWCCSVPLYLEDYAKNSMEEISGLQGFGLVTKNLQMDDPLAKTPEAELAIQNEVNQMQKKSVFDLKLVREWEDVKHEYSDAIVTTLNMLIGIKNFERGKAHWIYKGRAVVRGNNVETAQGMPF